MNICKCGCDKNAKVGNKYILGHNNRGQKSKAVSEGKLCACNCGNFLNILSNSNFIFGHKKNLIVQKKLCECNCGQYANAGRRFVRGHHIVLHNPSVKGRIPWNKGLTKETDKRLENRVISEEEKSCFENFCQCNCGQKCKNRFVRWHHRKGVATSERTKVLLSKSNTGKKRSDETRKRNSIANKGRASSHKGKTKLTNPELIFGGREKGYKHSEQERAAMRAGQNGPGIAEKRMRNSGQKRFPYVFPDGTIKKMRSNWEVLYVQYLDSLNIVWLYEPKGFLLSTGHRYFPDFYLPDLNEYHEVKGWMSPRSIKKMDLFKKEYPNEKLIIITEKPKSPMKI